MVATLLAWSSPLGAAVPAWARATRAALPAGATGVPQGYLPTLACPAVGACVAAGLYADAHQTPRGLLLVESAGRWAAPRTIAAPAGAAASPGLTPNALACAAVGSCAVVGAYQASGGITLPFALTEAGGRWTPARTVPLPAGAASTGQVAQLRGVACPAPGACVAVGTYVAAGTPAATVGFAVTQVGGVWGAPVSLPAPPDANLASVLGIPQVACSAVGHCVAIGTYLDTDNVQHGLVLSDVGGRWGPAQPVTPPPDASLYAHVTLSALACSADGSCTAVGTYYDHAGTTQLLALESRGGRWSPAVAIPAPAGAARDPRAFYYGYVDLACSSATTCAAGGQYVDAAGRYQGFLLDETGGVWSRATRLTLPRGASQVGRNGGVVALACPAAGSCRAGAAYLDAAGRYQALVLSQAHGRWLAGQSVVLPAGGASVGVDGGVYALACPSVTSCTAVGSYLAGATTYQGFLVATT